MLNFADRCYLNTRTRLEYMKRRAAASWKEMQEDEVGGTATVVIEIVMIGMVLVLGFIFRKRIGQLFTDMWNSLVVFGEKSAVPTVETVTKNPFE